MSREIKFRAWDKENEVYMNGYDVLLKCDGSAISRYALGALDTDMPVNVIIEQYTGLKDKNGKEIYEGDILGGIFEGCYIGWCDITKSFELFNCYERYCMACDGDILWCELSDSDIDLEVIGNIHESNMEELCPKE